MYLKITAISLFVLIGASFTTAEEGSKVLRSRSGGSQAASFRKAPEANAPQVRGRLAEKAEMEAEETGEELETPKLRTRSGGSSGAQTFRATK